MPQSVYTGTKLTSVNTSTPGSRLSWEDEAPGEDVLIPSPAYARGSPQPRGVLSHQEGVGFHPDKPTAQSRGT